jgi:undecaprenyl-diphosphatase
MIEHILLGIIQGLTEFLPVSSSGHLVLFGQWLHVGSEDMLLEVLLHFGTFLATILIFRKRIAELISGLFKREAKALQTAGWIIIASIPTGLMGVFAKSYFEKLFSSPAAVSGFLLFTGTVLFATRFAPKPQKGGIRWWQALIIGIAQSIAILPGISRSGSTICTALFLGVKREEAGEFSFLISLPAIFGATLLTAKDWVEAGADTTRLGLPMIMGVLFSFAVGLVALKWLLHFVKQGKMHLFAPYVWALGIFGLLWF